MKVIFLKQVSHIGQAGDVKDVADGYFRNFLLPQKLAKLANKAALKEVEVIKKKAIEQEAKDHESLKILLERLRAESFTLKRKANAEGQLFGSVSASDIVEVLHSKGYMACEERHIKLESQIKTVGTHTVPLKFAEDLQDSLQFTIEKEE